MSGNLTTFTCKMCGHCCQGTGGIIVSKPEWQRIADFLQISENDFLTNCTDKQGEKRRLKIGSDKYCLFFSEKGCTIHEVKPDICRAWPFFRGNLIDELSFKMAQDYCPGITSSMPHSIFAQEGKAYLQSLKLLKTDNSQAANALCIEKS